MSENNRDRLRSAILGAPPVLAEKLVEVRGMQFLLIEPSIKDSAYITAAGGMMKQRINSKTGETSMDIDLARYTVAAVISCTHDPESRARIFQPADEADLLRRSAKDPFLSALGEAATGFLKDGEEKAKNS